MLFSVLIIGISDSQFAFAGAPHIDVDGDGVFADPTPPALPDPDDNDPCVPNPNSQACINPQVGGRIIPIETTSLLLAGTQTFSWMIPVLLSAIGIGLFAVSKKPERS